ncbi:MAG: DUF4846 domain-containing protein [Sediminibacterium sp.]
MLNQRENHYMLSHPVKLLLVCCFGYTTNTNLFPGFDPSMRSVKEIPLPEGFERVPISPGFFADYLRNLPLKKDKTVYLYNKKPKPNQSIHYAVIDISTGEKDLQQCADAIMRIRAEYFFDKKLYDSIRFRNGNHDEYRFTQYLKKTPQTLRPAFLRFMETVFMYCGTYTLEQSLQRVPNPSGMQPGDVYVKGGAPGHAEIVVDMAVNKKSGKKIYMLAESYMPAQDIHLLLNPMNTALGPWHELNHDEQVVTASWIFSKNQLRRW